MYQEHKFKKEDSEQDIWNIVEKQKYWEKSQLNKHFQKECMIQVQESELLDGEQNKNLKRKMMKEFLKSVGIKIDRQQQGNISEKKFFEVLEKNNVQEKLLQKLRTFQEQYVKKLINDAELNTLPKKALGICFLFKIKHLLNLQVNSPENTEKDQKELEEEFYEEHEEKIEEEPEEKIDEPQEEIKQNPQDKMVAELEQKPEEEIDAEPEEEINAEQQEEESFVTQCLK